MLYNLEENLVNYILASWSTVFIFKSLSSALYVQYMGLMLWDGRRSIEKLK